MRETDGAPLFDREADFIHWLATLMDAHPDYSAVNYEPLLGGAPGRGSAERLARADLAVVRGGVEKIVIECKNRPIYGGAVDKVVEQLRLYRALYPDVVLVLALPARLAPQDAARVRAAGVEVWDLDGIARIFGDLISKGPSYIADALAAVPMSVVAQLRQELSDCAPGKAHWSIYQKLVGRILEHLFCPPLNAPLSESPDMSGVNRRDFIFANSAESGFWYHLRQRYAADYIVVDAKNYVGKVKKRDVLQMANYLRPHGAGLFGIIVSRVDGDNSAWTTAREHWAHYQKLVLVLTDSHVEAMLDAGPAGATAVVAKQIQDFRLAM